MIPPVAPAVLASNANFEQVYKHIVNNLLNSDASTEASIEPQTSTSDKLHAQRVSAAEGRILTASLFALCSSEDIPKDLRDLILVTASYISDASMLGLTEEEHELMNKDSKAFGARLHEITEALTTTLRSQHDTLGAIASSASEASSASKIPIRGTRPIDYSSSSHLEDLGSRINLLLTNVQQLWSRAIPSARYDAANALVLLLTSQTQYLQHLIRHLEQRKHGAETRHLVARAQFLSTVAQGLEAKTRTTYLDQRQELYSPQLRHTLIKKMNELDEEEEKITTRRRKLQAALDEYEDAGGDVMRTLGKKYGEIEEEIEGVKRDIERISEKDAVAI